jgi:hypothetical protein
MGHSSACRLSTRGSKLCGTALHVDCLQEGENYMGHRAACTRLSTRRSKLYSTALHVDCLQEGVNYVAQLCM